MGLGLPVEVKAKPTQKKKKGAKKIEAIYEINIPEDKPKKKNQPQQKQPKEEQPKKAKKPKKDDKDKGELLEDACADVSSTFSFVIRSN